MEAPKSPMPEVSVIVLAAVPLLTNRTVPPWTGFDAIGLKALSVIVILYLGATVRFTVARPLFDGASPQRSTHEPLGPP